MTLENRRKQNPQRSRGGRRSGAEILRPRDWRDFRAVREPGAETGPLVLRMTTAGNSTGQVHYSRDYPASEGAGAASEKTAERAARKPARSFGDGAVAPVHHSPVPTGLVALTRLR